MRIENWRGKEVFDQIAEQALENANLLMDDVVAAAKARCPVGTITREGKFVSANISFTPQSGKNKGKLVSFSTDKRWQGRNPGDLRNSIRRVTKPKTGSIRVYAGNFKIFWAYMVERGTAKTRAQPFLRPAFQSAKQIASRFIKDGA
jgi:HK97 gp10 family phage protein